MKIRPIAKFQMGGEIAEEPMMDSEAPEAGPVEPQGAGQDPLMQLAQVFAQGLQNQDCQLLMQGAQMFLQLIEQAQGGGAPAEPQGEPVFRKGGIISRRIKK